MSAGSYRYHAKHCHVNPAGDGILAILWLEFQVAEGNLLSEVVTPGSF